MHEAEQRSGRAASSGCAASIGYAGSGAAGSGTARHRCLSEPGGDRLCNALLRAGSTRPLCCGCSQSSRSPWRGVNRRRRPRSRLDRPHRSANSPSPVRPTWSPTVEPGTCLSRLNLNAHGRYRRKQVGSQSSHRHPARATARWRSERHRIRCRRCEKARSSSTIAVSASCRRRRLAALRSSQKHKRWRQALATRASRFQC